MYNYSKRCLENKTHENKYSGRGDSIPIVFIIVPLTSSRIRFAVRKIMRHVFPLCTQHAQVSSQVPVLSLWVQGQ